MTLRRRLAAALALSLLATALLATRARAAETRTWSKPGVRFTMEIPASMSLIDDAERLALAGVAAGSVVDWDGELELGVQFLLQLRPWGTPGVNPTMSIGTQPAGKDIRGWSPEKYARAQFDAMPQLIPGARNVTGLTTTTLGGLTFWTGETEFVAGGVQLRTKQWIRYEAKDKIVYVFSVSGEASAFGEAIGAFEPILATTSFAGKATTRGDALITATNQPARDQRAPALPATSAGDPVPGKDYVEEIFITWEPAKTPDAKLIEARMRAEPLMVNAVRGIDVALRFPRPLHVRYMETGVVNAWYSPGEHAVTMTYDLGVYLAKVFMAGGHPPEEAIRMSVDAMLFVLLHELGHAVIGELELPTTGKEEDSADEFATLIAAMVLPDAEAPSARAAARWFDLQAAQVTDVSQLLFWDEHSLDRQRTYRILANMFAHAPKKFRFVEQAIPAERLQEAQVRWPSKPDRWARLFAPWRETNPSGERGGAIPAPGGGRPADAGTFRIVMRDITDPRSIALQEIFRQKGDLEKMSAAYDGPFIWPRDFTVVLSDTGDMRSTLDRRKGEATISLGFVWMMQQKLMEKLGPEQGNEIFGGAVAYLIMQEVSRAILHEMQIAFTGEEEDAAAELTAIAMAPHPDGRAMAEAMAVWYQVLADEHVSIEQLKMWSPSSLPPQQFNDLLGMLHASDPATYAWVAGLIPAQRLHRASREFQTKTRNWERHLVTWAAFR